MKRSGNHLRQLRRIRSVRLRVADPVREEWEARVKAADEAGFNRGREAGERALSEQLVCQRAELRELQNGVLESMRKSLPDLIRECERHLVTLAIEVASKLVAGLPISTEMVESAVREALARAESGAVHQVFVHPDDLELLQKAASPLLETPDSADENIRFRGDDQISRGGCRVQTRFGIIDGTRENKVERIKESIAVH